MNDLAFADCARPAPVSVLRLELLPYSIGHEVLLLNERNPLLLETAESFADLPMANRIFAVKRAALVCSQTWRENHARQRWLRLWGWVTRNADYSLAAIDMRNYMIAGRRLPMPPSKHACDVLYGKDDEKGRAMGSPLMAQLFNFVSKNMDRFALTPATAWDAPLSLAGMLHFAELEADGRMRVENEAEEAERSALDKIEREIEAEKAEEVVDVNAGLATPPPDLS